MDKKKHNEFLYIKKKKIILYNKLIKDQKFVHSNLNEFNIINFKFFELLLEEYFVLLK